jgi:hypothetical protein
MQSNQEQPKKEYQKPELVVHGTLAQLTRSEEKDFRIRMLSSHHNDDY